MTVALYLIAIIEWFISNTPEVYGPVYVMDLKLLHLFQLECYA